VREREGKERRKRTNLDGRGVILSRPASVGRERISSFGVDGEERARDSTANEGMKTREAGQLRVVTIRPRPLSRPQRKKEDELTPSS